MPTTAKKVYPLDKPMEDISIRMLKTAMGSEILELFNDKKVIEIMVNPDGKLWVERLGDKAPEFTGSYISEDKIMNFISIIATSTNTTITSEKPILSAELPLYGSRFEAWIPPIVEKPSFTIRQKATMVYTLDDYVKSGIMTINQKEKINRAVKDRRNILVVGGTGTGKTTLTNAILEEIAKGEHRVFILEDTRELQCKAPNTVYLRTSDTMDMQKLLKSTMRGRPDRIIVGEVRDGAALVLLKAWNTGHNGGISTVHANNAAAGLTRLEQLIQEVIITSQQALIAEAIDIIISIERIGGERKISEILEVQGVKDGEYIFKEVI